MPEEIAPPEPQWVRRGKCQRCGRCCTQVITTMIHTNELQDYLEWLSLHQNIAVRRDENSNVVKIEINSKCKMLRFKQGKALCKIYENRPKVCHDFPTSPAGIGDRGCPGFVFTLESPSDPTKAS